jgi:phosphoribosylformylglycinamidine cyclo-ligase
LEKYPESCDPDIPHEYLYAGKYQLTDPSGIEDVDMGKLVLSPTRTYAPIVKEALKHYRKDIHGMVHCSGGAQTKVLHFVDNLHIVKDNLFPTPPLFKIIQEQSQTSWQEMYKVFNMGHRMELYVNQNIANELIALSKSFGVDAQIIGYCETATAKKATIRSQYGVFEY